MKLFTSLLFWLVLLGCISCGPSYHLKRARYHIAMAEAKGAAFHSDTLWQTIEIPIPEIRKDTLFKSSVGDTVVIQRDRLKIVYVKLKGDSVFIEGECQADTIRKNIYHTVKRTVYPPEKSFNWWLLVIAAIAGAGLILLIKR